MEEKRLENAGLNVLTARRKARRIAKAMLVTAAEWREEQRLLDATDRSPATHSRPLMERLSLAASQPEAVLEPHEKQPNALLRRIDSWIGILLGRGLRFLLSAAMLVLLAIWSDAHGILTFSQLREQAAELYRVSQAAVVAADPGLFRQLKWNIPGQWHRLADPLDFPWLHEVLGNSLPAFNLVVAATILLISLFARQRITAFLALAGTAVALFGPRWGLEIPSLLDRIGADAQARALGILIAVLGWFWPRRKPS